MQLAWKIQGIMSNSTLRGENRTVPSIRRIMEIRIKKGCRGVVTKKRWNEGSLHLIIIAKKF